MPINGGRGNDTTSETMKDPLAHFTEMFSGRAFGMDASAQDARLPIPASLRAATPQAWLNYWSAVGHELSQFGQDRLQANLETMRALGNCNSLPDVMQVQQAHMQALIQDYNDEMAALGRIGQATFVTPVDGEAVEEPSRNAKARSKAAADK